MVQNKKKWFEGSPKKQQKKKIFCPRGHRKKNICLVKNFSLCFPRKTMLCKKRFGQFGPKKMVRGVAKKKFVRENPHHAPPQMINGHWSTTMAIVSGFHECKLAG